MIFLQDCGIITAGINIQVQEEREQKKLEVYQQMNQRIKKKLVNTGKVFIIIYILGGVVLYLIQDLILFHPKSVQNNHAFSFSQSFEEINIAVENRNVNIVKFKTDNPQKGLVLFFHGNMENVEHYKKYPSFFTKNGYEIWMIDYPGFGKSTGKRSEENIDKDALILYDMALKKFAADSIIIFGKSIGTGVAAYLASVKECKKLLLETPYYSIDALAKHYFPIYPVLPMTKYSFPIYQYLKKIKAPITIFSGTNDEVIPHKQAQWLNEENKTIELIKIEGGHHNNLSGFEMFQKKLDSLLQH